MVVRNLSPTELNDCINPLLSESWSWGKKNSPALFCIKVLICKKEYVRTLCSSAVFGAAHRSRLLQDCVPVDIWCTSATLCSFLLRNLVHVWWNSSVNPTNTQQVAMNEEFNSQLLHSSEPKQMKVSNLLSFTELCIGSLVNKLCLQD